MLNFRSQCAERGCPVSIFSAAQATASWFPLSLGSLVIANITDWNAVRFNMQNACECWLSPATSEWSQRAQSCGHSEESHCGCLSSFQRLHFLTEIKHLACSRIAFENYALMIAAQASSLVIFLWPLSRASQFGHFFNKYFLGAYHVLGTMQSAGCSSG